MAVSHLACIVAILIPGPLHSQSSWPLRACGFGDRAKPKSSVGTQSYYFPEGNYDSGHSLSVRFKGQGVLVTVNSDMYLWNIWKVCISPQVTNQRSY